MAKTLKWCPTPGCTADLLAGTVLRRAFAGRVALCAGEPVVVDLGTYAGHEALDLQCSACRVVVPVNFGRLPVEGEVSRPPNRPKRGGRPRRARSASTPQPLSSAA